MASRGDLSIVVARGSWGTVEFVVRDSGKVPAKQYLDELDKIVVGNAHAASPAATAADKFRALFQYMANYGKLRPKRFGKEAGDLYAFKHVIHNKQIRFVCFPDGRKWLVTHGFQKPGAQKKRGRWPKEQVERGHRIMTEYLNRQQKRKRRQ